MNQSPVQGSLGIDFVRFFSRPCVSAQRVNLEVQTGETLARSPADCSQNGAQNLRSASGLALQRIMVLSKLGVFRPMLSPRSLPNQCETIDFSRSRDSFGSKTAP